MKPSINKWLLVALGLVVVLTLANAGIAYRNSRQLHNDAYWVAHTHEVLEALGDVLSTMIDAETGQRGFLITGDNGYLAPYTAAVASAEPKLAHLASLAGDDDKQQARIARLRELVHEKLDELTRTIDLYRDFGFEAARKEVLTHLGKNRMDAIRVYIAGMQADERALLSERQQANDRAYVAAMVSGPMAAVMALAALAAFIWVLRRHLKARLKAASVLYEQREWLRTTLTSIGDGVIATDTEGRVTFLNTVAEGLTGWKESEAKGQSLLDVFRIVNEKTRREVDNPALRALKEGTIVGLANHTLLIARRGKERPIEDSAAPIREVDGRVVGVVLVFRDVSERRRAEGEIRASRQQLEQRAEQLAEADRRKDEFLAILAHELRNPLAPMRNALRILQTADTDEPTRVKVRDIMDRQLSHMVRLVDDLLDMSRITRGLIEVRKSRVRLATVIDMAVETSRAFIEAMTHEFTVAGPATPLYVDGDATRLAQVVGNLLTNAAKYTPPGGHIQLTATQRDSEALISVRDDGVGIPPAMLSKVFDMFTQVNRTVELSDGGLGIGLTLVRRLVEMHGGRVEAHSAGLGQGSEFVVHLPLSQAEPLPQDNMPAGGIGGPASAGAKRRIVIADDNKDAANSLALLLTMMGHQVRTTYDGLAAVEAVAAFEPDVVLLDIGMPILNGYDAARRIREALGDRPIVLVAMTGWGQDEDRRRSKEAGIDYHMVKPVEPAELVKILATVNEVRGFL